MAQHARLSASNTKQWSVCPGPTAVLERRPDMRSGSNVYADMGTCAHHLVELCLRTGTDPDAYEGRWIKITTSAGGYEGTSMLRPGATVTPSAGDRVHLVDQDMAEATTHMVDYVRRRCLELGLVTLVASADDPGPLRQELAERVAGLVARGIVRLEQRVVPLPHREDTGGTGDVVIDAWPVLLEVVDYKNGSGVFVPVERNEQLRSYTLGTLHELGTDYLGVRYTICQPRHLKSPLDGVMFEESTPAEIVEWGEWLSGRADRVDEARAVVAEADGDLDYTLTALFERDLLSVGEDGAHCQWCELADRCPAARARVEELAAADFDDDPHGLEAPEPASTDHLSVLAPWMPFVVSWASKVISNTEAALLQGLSVAGMKVVRGKSPGRKLNADATPEAVEQYLREEGLTGGKLEGMWNPPSERTLRTGPQLEKLLPPKRRKAFEDEFMFKPEGKLTVAPESDPSPAVTVDPAADFDDDPEVPDVD